MAKTRHDFVFSATSTSASKEIGERGQANRIVVDVTDFTNAVTVTVAVKDDEGYTLWSKAAIPKGGVVAYGNGPDAAASGEVPLLGRGTIDVTLSGAAGGAGGSVKVRTYFEPEC